MTNIIGTESVVKDLWVSYSKDGKMSISKNLDNIRIILNEDSHLKGKIRLNLLTGLIEKHSMPFADSNGIWGDIDTSELVIFIQRAYGVSFASAMVNEVVPLIASHNAYHPIKDYLSSLHWDGVLRVDRLFPNYFGTNDNEYSKVVGKIMLLSAVARVLDHGCKVDTVPILEGEQGINKSTALRKLTGSKWFKDERLELDSGKDTLMQLSGVWIYEFAELAGVKKADTDSLKSFISKQVDTYRPPYGRYLKEFPRQLIFVGTINYYDGYLKDTTGNRRYLPIKCGNIDVDAIEHDRDQLWAEAVARYKAGEKWYWERGSDIDKLIRSEVEQREDYDVWNETISSWLNKTIKDTCTIGEIWEDCFGKPIVDLKRAEQIRLGTVLKSLGWLSRQIRRDGSRIREYFRTTPFDVNTKITEVRSPAPTKIINSAMNVIFEKCNYDANNAENEEVQAKLNRAWIAGHDILDIAETFGETYMLGLKTGKSQVESWSGGMRWIESFLRGEVTS
jgi:putative DNA primase/helicase